MASSRRHEPVPRPRSAHENGGLLKADLPKASPSDVRSGAWPPKIVSWPRGPARPRASTAERASPSPAPPEREDVRREAKGRPFPLSPSTGTNGFHLGRAMSARCSADMPLRQLLLGGVLGRNSDTICDAPECIERVPCGRRLYSSDRLEQGGAFGNHSGLVANGFSFPAWSLLPARSPPFSAPPSTWAS